MGRAMNDLLAVLLLVSAVWFGRSCATSSPPFVSHGCLSDDAQDPLFYSLMSADPFTPTSCLRACKEDEKMYGALQLPNGCVCSSGLPDGEADALHCDAKCGKDNSFTFGCGKEDTSYFHVYSRPPGRLANISVVAEKSSTPACVEVTYNVSMPDGWVKHQFFGCGLSLETPEWAVEPATDPPRTVAYNCIYWVGLPNPSFVTVQFEDDSTGEVETDEKELEVTITNPSIFPPRVDCPDIYPGNTPMICNVSVYLAFGMTLEIMYGDETEESKLLEPDSDIVSLGEIVPQVLVDMTSHTPLTGPTTVKLYEGNVTYAGYILAFEAYTKNKTSLTFTIAMPSCVDSSSCPAVVQYSVRSNFSIPENLVTTDFKTYQYRRLKLPTPTPVFPGDKICLTVDNGGTVMMIPSDPGDEKMVLNNGMLDKDSSKVDGRCLASAIVSTISPVPLNHTYKSEGNFEIAVSLSDPEDYSDVGVALTATQIMMPLLGLNMKTLNNYVKTEDNTGYSGFEATLESGGNCNLTWDFGDGTNLTANYTSITKDTRYHPYKTPGVYNVTVVATNKVSFLSKTTEIYVQRPVQRKDWEVIGNMTFLVPPGNIELEIQFKGSDGLPTNATAQISWGDGKMESIVISEDDNQVIYKAAHDYSEKGKRTIDIIISNNVSNIELQHSVEGIEKIINLTAQLNYVKNLDDAANGSLRLGFGPQHNCFIPESVIVLTMNWNQGRIEGYTDRWANGTALKSTGLDWKEDLVILGLNEFIPHKYIAYRFSQTGDYNLSLSPYNSLQKDYPPIYVYFRIINEMAKFTVNDTEIITNLTELKTFLFYTEDLDPTACFMINYNDSSPVEMYGYESTCEQVFSNIKDVLPVDLFITNFTHNYTKVGKYKVFVKGCNEGLSCYNVTVDAEVKRLICKPAPQAKIRYIQIQNMATSPETAYEKLMSADSKFLTDLGLEHCTAEVQATRWWNVSRLNESSHDILNTIEVDNALNAKNSATLFIPGKFLPLGLYLIQFTAKIYPKIDPNDKDATVQTTTVMYLRVQRSNLTAGIMKYFVTSIRRGDGKIIVMDPLLYSSDPDETEPNESAFKIEWYCCRVNENFKGEEPDYEGSTVVLVPTGNHSSSDNGGCFGTGPGRVELQNAKKWELNTTSLYRYEKGNETDWRFTVKVIVRKDERWATAKLELYIAVGNPPTIEIACREEGLCFPFNGKIVINPNLRLALRGRCLEDCNNIAEFRWSCAKYIETTQELEPIPGFREKYTTLGYNEEIAVFPEFFQTFNTTKVFEIRLTVTTSDGNYGFAGMQVQMNTAPYGGVCSIIETTRPPVNKALFSRYTISCNDWKDEEHLKIVMYTMYLKMINFTLGEKGGDDKPGEWTMSLCYGPQPECVALLPYGKMEIYVDIQDELQAVKTEQIDGIIETTLPGKEEFIAYQNSDWIHMLKTDGNQFTLTQTFKAMQTVTSEIAKQLNDDEQTALKKASTAIVTYLENMDDISLDNLEDIQQSVSTIGTFLGSGGAVDSKGKAELGNFLMKIQSCLDNMTISAPSQLQGVATASIQVIGAMITSNKNSIMGGEILPTDMEASATMEYDTDVVIDDIKEGQTVEQLMKAAVIREQEKKVKLDIAKASMLIQKISTMILSATVVNEKPFSIEAPLAQAVFVKYNSESNTSQAGFEFPSGGGKFIPPDICTMLGKKNCSSQDPVAFAGVSWATILYSNGANLDLISDNTKTIELNAFTSQPSTNITRLQVKNCKSDFDLFIPKHQERKDNCTSNNTCNKENEDNSTDIVIVQPKLKWFEYMMYHQFNVNKPGSSASIEVTPGDRDAKYIVFIRHSKKPTLNNFDLVYNLNTKEVVNGTENTRSIFVTTEELGNNKGYYYVGISQLRDDAINYKESNITKTMVNQNFTSEYSVRIFTSNCAYYDKFFEDWKTDGCTVFKATVDLTHCKCNHLTAFAAGFFVMPNSIDFDYVFANASFADNLTIYMTIIVTLALFVLFLIWARRKDRKDREKLGAIPLANDNPNHKYLYEILVFTGHDVQASTDSKVFFVLTGDLDETDIKTFECSQRKIFRRDGTDVFIMTTPRPLGQLQYLRIWHNNSGKGNFASWYLNYVVFRDVQTGEKFEFICNSWLAVEKDDGLIDRILPVAGKDELTEFGHLFHTSARKNLADGHLWFSVFLRPPRSRFTRCQRVASCMALLYLSMLANCMWYGTVPEKPTVDSLKLGPFNLSLEQISIGFMSNIIVFPPSFLIMFFFRKSRPRKLRPSRVTEALKQQRDDALKNSKATAKADKKEINKVYEKKHKFSLPWFFSVIAWILCVGCIFVAVFFLWAYGIQFGNEKTMKWLTSLLVAFFSSILITQPIKIFLLAMIFSSLCKKVETDDDDADEDEESPELQYDEQWLQDDPLKPRKVAYKPETSQPENIEQARQNRRKEVKMWDILKEILGYLIFLWILSVVGYGVRDPNAFYLRQNLVREFVNEGGHYGDFNKITDISKFRIWFERILLSRLKPTNRYNGKPAIGWMGLVKDGTNRLLGPPILRQIRTSPGAKCNYHPVLKNFTKPACMDYQSGITEDTNSYSPHWKKHVPPQKDVNMDKDTAFYKPFRYTSPEEYKTSMVWAKMKTYSGGGYVFELLGTKPNITKNYIQLRKHGWIDPRTAALITEFSMFNAQVDLFSVVKLVLEMEPGGGTSSYVRINTLRLLSYKDGLGNFNLLCQLVWVVFVIYYTIRELIQFCKEGRHYFKQFWNIIETLVNLLSYGAIVAFIMRYMALLRVLKDAKEGHYLRPVDLNSAQQLDELFCYFISLIIFLSIIKFNKILRFNNRMAMLSTCISQCTKDLRGFAVVFAVGFMSFGVLFRLIFNEFYKCQSMYATLTTLFTIMLNRFAFDNFFDQSPTVGPIVFFIFVFCFNIILINIFLAIMIQSFEKVKEDLGSRPNKYNIMEFMIRRLKGIVGVGARRPMNPKPKTTNGDKEEGMSVATKELPEKVDRLLDYINTVYFEGKLDFQNKEFLLKQHRAPLNSN